MKVKIFPSTPSGRIMMPSSKSLFHRALICAALAKGESTIYYYSSLSEDIKATLEGLKYLETSFEIFDDKIVVKSKGFNSYKKCVSFSVNESGSSLRMLIPIFSLIFDETKISGTKKLFERPLNIYEEIFEKQNLKFEREQDFVCFSKGLNSGVYEIKGNSSSQFISGLLFALPLLDESSKIIITESYESKSYVDLTIQVLNSFGIKIIEEKDNVYLIKGKQRYQKSNFIVEGDYSQMAFFGVLAAINKNLEIANLRHDSKQGDRVIVDILKKANVKVEKTCSGYIIEESDLLPFEVSLKDCPDLGPILFVLASVIEGKSKIYDIARLRLKESDRVQAMVDNLKKVNTYIEIKEDLIIISKGEIADEVYYFDAYNDHRIFMALSVLATILPKGAIIEGANCIKKSYPDFLNDLSKINIKFNIQGELI